jgi:hypothetical protein
MTYKLIQNLIQFLVALLSLFMISFLRPALAGEDKDRGPDLGNQYKRAAEELAGWFQKEVPADRVMTVETEPDLGFYLENISFKDAHDLNYSGNYGVLVGSSRDWDKEAQLHKGSIIFMVDGIRVKHRSHLEQLLQDKEIGDTLSVKYFSEGQIFQKPLSVQAKGGVWDFTKEYPDKTKLRDVRGLGGAAYKPIYLHLDNATLNDLFNTLGFNDLSSMSSLYHGFDFQGLVGNGNFVGGFGAWSRERQNNQATINNNISVTRNLKYRSGMGGISFDKRYRLSDRWIFSTGLLLGGGGTQFEIDQLSDDIDWQQLEADSLGSYNDYMRFKKRYCLLQPRVSLMYRVLPVFWIKVEAGYILSYSKNGWQNIVNDHKYDVSGPANETSLNGFTISITPWLGF